MPSYQESFDHLSNFITNLPSTRIKFVYFLAHKLDAPLVKSEFRKFSSATNTYYLIQGKQPQFIYAYKESDLKFLFKYDEGPNAASLQPSTFNTLQPRQVTLLHSQEALGVTHDVTYAGNHIDFATLRQKDNDTLCKVHYTWYDNWFDHIASRSTLACNYRMSGTYQSLDSLKDFKTVACVGKDNKVTGATCSVFDDEADIVWTLTRVASGLQPINDYVQKGGRKYKCRYGCRGGRYIIANGKKKYLKQICGGAPSIFDDERFMNFIRDKIIIHVAAALGDRLDEVTIFYDEANELSSPQHDIMVFKYDMDDLHNANFYYVDANILKTAFFALDKLEASRTLIDNRCLHYVDSIPDIILQRVSTSA